ncbi:MAG: right-handed parallel beta-helix repeat-containing protein [Clostridia bacterium]|nr:right-handed parallel beta-helix repeat-containing protein [Clostridia bacterium]
MKKRLTAVFLSILLLLGTVPVWAVGDASAYMTFYVSPNGDDSGDGSENAPFRTLERARDEVRKHNKTMTGDIVVNLLPGRYERTERFELDPEDSGFNGFDVIWRGTDKTNLATISGAAKIDGTWTEGENGIWHVKAENLDFAREMFINGETTVRARNPKNVWGIKKYTDPNNPERELGFYIEKSKVGLFENPEDVETHHSHTWKSAIIHVDNIIQDPENPDQSIVIMDEQYWPVHMTNAAGTNEPHWSRGFLIENAYELLDEPGEFYFNKKTKILSYYPREGEDLNNSEVLVPRINQLLLVRGQSYRDEIHNIRFEDIKLAHTTNTFLEKLSYSQGQGEYVYTSETSYRMGVAANIVSWASDVHFEGCVFYGLTAMGLHFKEGVHDSSVKGCVFSDLGATGFAAGTLVQLSLTPPKNPDALGDVAWQAAWEAPNRIRGGEGTPNQTLYEFVALNTLREDEENYGEVGYGWFSKFGLVQDIQQYIKVDFDRLYTLETVKFSFPSNATTDEKSNFEILLSKDYDFKDAKVVATVEKNTNSTVEFPVKDGEKYRYLMIRKTAAGEDLALNGVWAMSKDRGPRGDMGLGRNYEISNNYFIRCAQQLWNTYPIWINFTYEVDILHNEIYDAPYSGMSIGWGWDRTANVLVGKNNISNNRIDNVMRYVNDGGGIYIFGKQYDTVLRENYISNVFNLEAGAYNDNGSTGISWYDNVVVNTGNAWILNNGSRNNKMMGLWSDVGTYQIADGTYVDNIYTAENAKIFSLSKRPDKVTEIMGKAGLEPDWKWVKDRVPDNQSYVLYGPEGSEAYHVTKEVGLKAPKRVDRDVLIANKIIDTGVFGDLPWQYAPEHKTILKYWVERIASKNDRTDDVSGGHIEEMFHLERAIVAANESIVHPSYDEMVKMCDELAANATTDKVWGGYDAAAMTKFKNAVAEVKATNPGDEGAKAIAAGKLENIYADVAARCYTAEIRGFKYGEAETEIDAENKKVTVYLPKGTDRKAIVPEIEVNDSAKVAVEASSFNWTKDSVRVPLFETNLRKYVYWTVEFRDMVAQSDNSVVSGNPDDWTKGNPNTLFGNGNGIISISPWHDAAMCGKALGNEINFSINAKLADVTEGIGMIFAAQTTDVEALGTEAKNAHYLLLLKGQNLELYKVDGGVRTICAEAKGIDFKYGKFNPFKIEITEEGKVDRIKVYIEGDMIIDTLAEEHIDDTGYFGILSRQVGVLVK